jgi:opacity protein-like surface antigen
MKIRIAPLLFAATALPVFAGQMGPVETSMGQTYIMIGGGYYAGQYQSNFTRHDSGILTIQQSFDDAHSSGYGQLGLGTNADFGPFMFDHQISVNKLWGTESFSTASSLYEYKQTVDFGYDFMPKMKLFQSLSAYGILGAHYARFHYSKATDVAAATSFDANKDQLGINLGAGLNYQINANFAVGVKYQHWQYQETQVQGTNALVTQVDRENITPTFNLVGVELRYYWS